MSLLKPCSEVWGEVELREGVPSITTFQDSIYVPYSPDGVWGLFGTNGHLHDEGVDLHGPTGLPHQSQDQLDVAHLSIEAAPETTYIYGGVLNPHYGHFLVNSLSRLWPLVDNGRIQHRILFHAGAKVEQWLAVPFVREIFNALDLSVDSIAIFERPTHIRNLILPASSLQEQHFIHSIYGDLCRMIGRNLLSEFTPKRGLSPAYLTKTGLTAGVGRVVNEKAMERRLQAAGVEIIHPELLSLKEQIGLFLERPAVIGTVGSAFHTSVFAPASARSIILSTIPGPNSNFLLINAVSRNIRVEYFYPKNTRVIDSSDKLFWTNFEFEHPERIADEIIEILILEKTMGVTRPS